MIAGALYTQRGGHANPQRTSQAFAWALLDRGGNIRENTPVLGIEVSHGKASGVRTADGIISAGAVVVCAGPQVALLCRPLGITVPVAAARLEGFVSTPLPPQFDVALVGNGLSVRQTRRGNIHFSGGPHEWINVELASEPPKPSTAIVRGAARRLLELFPTFENAALLRCWAGVVEVTPDHACLIENRALDGLVIASASGHGIGLSPALGKAISELVTDRRSSIPIDGLGLDRFNELDPNWANERRWVAGEYNT
jgi:sarcosine oxidase subunit beta